MLIVRCNWSAYLSPASDSKPPNLQANPRNGGLHSNHLACLIVHLYAICCALQDELAARLSSPLNSQLADHHTNNSCRFTSHHHNAPSPPVRNTDTRRHGHISHNSKSVYPRPEHPSMSLILYHTLQIPTENPGGGGGGRVRPMEVKKTQRRSRVLCQDTLFRLSPMMAHYRMYFYTRIIPNWLCSRYPD